MQIFYTTESLELVFDELTHGPGGLSRRRGLACRAGEHEPTRPDAPSSAQVRMRLNAVVDGRATDSSLYLAATVEFFARLPATARSAGYPNAIKLLSAKAASQVFIQGSVPRLLQGAEGGTHTFVPIEEQITALHTKGPLRIAIVNPYGSAFGDAIVSMTSLRILRERLEACVGQVVIDIFQHPFNIEAEALYLRSGIVNAIRHFPTPLTVFARYQGYFDAHSSKLHGELAQSRSMPWIDAMLLEFAIDPRSIPIQEKRNQISVSTDPCIELRSRLAAHRSNGYPIILLHPEASSPIRSIPELNVMQLIYAILQQTDWQIAITSSIDYKHDRLLHWDDATPTFEHFVALIDGVDGVLCADTCTYHIADACDTPAVTILSSVLPLERVRYYPFVKALQLEQDDHRLLGRHYSTDAADFAWAAAAWARFDSSAAISLLQALMQRSINNRSLC